MLLLPRMHHLHAAVRRRQARARLAGQAAGQRKAGLRGAGPRGGANGEEAGLHHQVRGDGVPVCGPMCGIAVHLDSGVRCQASALVLCSWDRALQGPSACDCVQDVLQQLILLKHAYGALQQLTYTASPFSHASYFGTCRAFEATKPEVQALEAQLERARWVEVWALHESGDCPIARQAPLPRLHKRTLRYSVPNGQRTQAPFRGLRMFFALTHGPLQGRSGT